MHRKSLILLKRGEKQVIASGARPQAVGAGLCWASGWALSRRRLPAPLRPPPGSRSRRAGRCAAPWRPGRELPPCPLRAGRAEPSRSGPGRHGRAVPRGADVPGAAVPAERLGLRVPERGGGARPGRVPRSQPKCKRVSKKICE